MHWSAFRHYQGKLAGNFDVVVDEINTIPFFTPLWADIPVVAFIHQLAREVWWYESPFPLSALGFFAEPLYLRAYRRVPAITVSESTKLDLTNLGFVGPMTVLPEGLEPLTVSSVTRPAHPTFLYAGRLAPSKRVSDVIRAFAAFDKSSDRGELRLLGDGRPEYIRALHKLARDLGVSERVRFLGRISRERKHMEMAGAHMLLLASAREGWGLVVIEANAFGTPAVAYDVPGLRDSIRHEKTGLLVRPSPEALAGSMIRLWSDSSLYERLATGAKAWSVTFSFENTAIVFRHAISGVLNGRLLERQRDGGGGG